MPLNEIYRNQKNVINETLTEEISGGSDPLLSFEIGDSKFAITFTDIYEIVEYFPYTEYPTKSDFYLGVINLRGNIVPIVNPFQIQITGEDLEGKRYVILQTEDKLLVGIVVQKVRKVEVKKGLINPNAKEEIISVDGKPVRYIQINHLLEKIRKE